MLNIRIHGGYFISFTKNTCILCVYVYASHVELKLFKNIPPSLPEGKRSNKKPLFSYVYVYTLLKKLVKDYGVGSNDQLVKKTKEIITITSTYEC